MIEYTIGQKVIVKDSFAAHRIKAATVKSFTFKTVTVNEYIFFRSSQRFDRGHVAPYTQERFDALNSLSNAWQEEDQRHRAEIAGLRLAMNEVFGVEA